MCITVSIYLPTVVKSGTLPDNQVGKIVLWHAFIIHVYMAIWIPVWFIWKWNISSILLCLSFPSLRLLVQHIACEEIKKIMCWNCLSQYSESWLFLTYFYKILFHSRTTGIWSLTVFRSANHSRQYSRNTQRALPFMIIVSNSLSSCLPCSMWSFQSSCACALK